VEAQKMGEMTKAFRERIFDMVYILSREGREQQEIRVRQNSETNSKRMLTNHNEPGTAENISAVR
jgi:hypothetical protein